MSDAMNDGRPDGAADEPVPAPGGPAVVGGLLREAREARGLSVAQVADGIRVSPRHIRAIEAGRIGELPEGPYGRGFVEAFSAFVGLDPAATLSRLAGPEDREGEGRRIFRYPERTAFHWRDWTVPIAFAASLAALAVARSFTAPRPVPAPTAHASAAVPAERPPHPALVGGAEDAPVPAGAPAPEADPADGVRVLLRSEGSTWVSAASDGGPERRYELGPGENLTLTAHARLTLSLGDAGLVRVRRGTRELGFVGERGEERRGMVFTAERDRPGAAAQYDAAAGD